MVGDAALMSGLSLEALNDIGQRKTRMLIVLNDNEMSISPTVGALSQYLSPDQAVAHLARLASAVYDDAVEQVPLVGPALLEWSQRFRKSVVDFAQPGQLFEDLGITYVGPVPGHSLRRAELRASAGRCATWRGRCIVHVRTQKGRGYQPAVADKVSFHGAALPPMTVVHGGVSGAPSQSAVQSGDGDATPSMAQAVAARCEAAQLHRVMAARADRASPASDPRIVAITAGMPTGTGLAKFAAEFPDRMYDVGIAEQHAVTMATGLALAGLRPFVAIYSTFLQRAFDQLVHDVCQNDAPVVIGVDRAGLVGEDGTSHQGMFALACPAPAAQPGRSPRPRTSRSCAGCCTPPSARTIPSRCTTRATPASTCPTSSRLPIPVGQAELLRDGNGHPDRRLRADRHARRSRSPSALAADGWSVGVVNARFAKPLDRDLIVAQRARQEARGHARGKRRDRRLRVGRARGAGGRRAGRRERCAP